MSRLPPTRRGGTTEWRPALGGRVADRAGEGLQRHARVLAVQRRLHARRRRSSRCCSAGSLNWSASSPKPGMFAVQPKPDGLNASIVTFSASPGSAPSTIDRPGDRIDLAEVEPGDVGDRAVGRRAGRPRRRGTRTRSSSRAPPARPGQTCCPSRNDGAARGSCSRSLLHIVHVHVVVVDRDVDGIDIELVVAAHARRRMVKRCSLKTGAHGASSMILP